MGLVLFVCRNQEYFVIFLIPLLLNEVSHLIVTLSPSYYLPFKAWHLDLFSSITRLHVVEVWIDSDNILFIQCRSFFSCRSLIYVSNKIDLLLKGAISSYKQITKINKLK